MSGFFWSHAIKNNSKTLLFSKGFVISGILLKFKWFWHVVHLFAKFQSPYVSLLFTLCFDQSATGFYKIFSDIIKMSHKYIEMLRISEATRPKTIVKPYCFRRDSKFLGFPEENTFSWHVVHFFKIPVPIYSRYPGPSSVSYGKETISWAIKCLIWKADDILGHQVSHMESRFGQCHGDNPTVSVKRPSRPWDLASATGIILLWAWNAHRALGIWPVSRDVQYAYWCGPSNKRTRRQCHVTYSMLIDVAQATSAPAGSICTTCGCPCGFALVDFASDPSLNTWCAMLCRKA